MLLIEIKKLNSEINLLKADSIETVEQVVAMKMDAILSAFQYMDDLHQIRFHLTAEVNPTSSLIQEIVFKN